jgi:hypothetical protein
MRGVISLLLVLALSACGGVASGVEAAGRYRANWDQHEQLVLNSDFTFQHVRSDGSSASGTWLLDTSTGDTRVQMREAGREGVSAPSIHRTLSGEVFITMSQDENRAFVKVD